MALRNRVLLPWDIVLPMVLTSLLEALTLVPVCSACLGGKARSPPWPWNEGGKEAIWGLGAANTERQGCFEKERPKVASPQGQLSSARAACLYCSYFHDSNSYMGKSVRQVPRQKRPSPFAHTSMCPISWCLAAVHQRLQENTVLGPRGD